MNEKELKEWFWDKFNSCYRIYDKPTKNFYMIYDIDYIRAKKLANILNKEVQYPTEMKGVCLFNITYSNNYFWCDYENIYSFLRNNIIPGDFISESKLMNGFLKEHKECVVFNKHY